MTALRHTVGIVLAVAAGAAGAAAQGSSASQSAAAAKEVLAALQARKIDVFAVRDRAQPGRFVAVLNASGVELLVVSAAYEKVADLEARFYHKDFMGVYQDLNSSIYARDKVFISDAGANGLMPQPPRNTAPDSITLGGDEVVFDGRTGNPRPSDPNRRPRDEYQRLYADADARYMRLLGLLLEELRKS